MASRSPGSLPAKVQRRVRRVARDGARSVRRSTGAAHPLPVDVTADPASLAQAVATLTPWATRRALRITASGPSTLRALAAALDPAATVLDLDVIVELPPRWPSPKAPGRIDLPGIDRVTVSARPKRLKVGLRLRQEVSLARALWAVSAVLTPSVPPHAHGSADIHLAEGGHPELAAFAIGAQVQFGDYPDTEARDVETSSAIGLPGSTPTRPVIDLSVANPIGLALTKVGALTSGTLRIDGGLVDLGDGARSLLSMGAGRLLDEEAVLKIRGLSGATATVSGDPRAAAQRLAELAATGLVVHAPELTESVRDHLDPALAEALAQNLPAASASIDDRLAWRVRSTSLRRAALRGHAAPIVLAESTGAHAWPEVSVLLVTNRVAMVADALRSVARQRYPRLEVILGLHGASPDDLPADAQEVLGALTVPVTTLELDAADNLGQALAACTRAANGTLLVKMDDDDRYGPEHVGDLVLARMFTGAELVGKAPEITELQASRQLLQRSFPAEEAWGEYIIGATMLVARGPLIDVGGWRPTPWAVDKALLDRFSSSGRNVYRTHNLGWAYVRRGDGHTWARDDEHFVSQAKHVWRGDAAATVLDLVVNGD